MVYDEDYQKPRAKKAKGKREPKEILSLTMYASRALWEKWCIDAIAKGDFAMSTTETLYSTYEKIYKCYEKLFNHTNNQYDELNIELKRKHLREKQKRDNNPK